MNLVREGRALSGADVLAAWTRRDRLRESLVERLSDYDAVLTFAASGPAPLASEGTGDPIFATLWTLIGAPAYSLPLMSGANGLPVGVQAVAAPGRDIELTRAAAWLMRAAAPMKRGFHAHPDPQSQHDRSGHLAHARCRARRRFARRPSRGDYGAAGVPLYREPRRGADRRRDRS